jgi:hypothetical protein
MAISVNRKKRRRGRPKVGSTLIGVRIVPSQLAALDRWRKTQKPRPNRPEAIRRLLDAALKGEK